MKPALIGLAYVVLLLSVWTWQGAEPATDHITRPTCGRIAMAMGIIDILKKPQILGIQPGR